MVVGKVEAEGVVVDLVVEVVDSVEVVVEAALVSGSSTCKVGTAGSHYTISHVLSCRFICSPPKPPDTHQQKEEGKKEKKESTVRVSKSKIKTRQGGGLAHASSYIRRVND